MGKIPKPLPGRPCYARAMSEEQFKDFFYEQGYKIVTLDNETFDGTKLSMDVWNWDKVNVPIVYVQGFHFALTKQDALRAYHQRKLKPNQKFIRVIAPKPACDYDGNICASVVIGPTELISDISIRENLNLFYGNPKYNKL